MKKEMLFSLSFVCDILNSASGLDRNIAVAAFTRGGGWQIKIKVRI